MSDIVRYTRQRAARDPEFEADLETGYEQFRVGVLLRQAREEAGLTQEQVAEQLETKKSTIIRIENHAGDIRLSTLERYARALGRQLNLELLPASRGTGRPEIWSVGLDHLRPTGVGAQRCRSLGRRLPRDDGRAGRAHDAGP